jgi:hypothetical protein
MGGWPDAGGGRNCRSYRCIRLSQFAAVTKLEPVSIVVGGLIFAFGEGQSKRTLAGIIFGVGMSIGAVNFMAWLFP